MLDDIEFVVQDPISKKSLSSNEIGEILIKGYNICNGYYKIPNEKQPFDNDGYLHTGDLGYIDEDKYLVLTGRLKDIIIRKGENISPAEIEKAFEKYKEFTKVRVIGIPSLTYGENYYCLCRNQNTYDTFKRTAIFKGFTFSITVFKDS